MFGFRELMVAEVDNGVLGAGVVWLVDFWLLARSLLNLTICFCRVDWKVFPAVEVLEAMVWS